MNYVVEFIGLDVNIPIEERTFKTKHEASVYKHEHELGKFATVLRMTGTFTS